MRIGVFGNPEHEGLPGIVERLQRHADELGVELVYGTGTLSGDFAPDDLGEEWDELDLLLTLGGDGTLLQGARVAAPRDIPVAGCNLGRLGFLTAAPAEELEGSLERLVAGDYREESRLALDVRVVRGQAEEASDEFYALNDAVVHKSGFARLITLRVRVDDEEVGQYSADGIVVATATGSTAYSLSAGGPVLVPTLDALVATPISPHTLAVRPIVVPSDSRIVVEVRPRSQDTILTVDGQAGVELGAGDRIEVERSSHPVRLVQFPEQSFFSVLRRKLRWGDVEARER